MYISISLYIYIYMFIYINIDIYIYTFLLYFVTFLFFVVHLHLPRRQPPRWRCLFWIDGVCAVGLFVAIRHHSSKQIGTNSKFYTVIAVRGRGGIVPIPPSPLLSVLVPSRPSSQPWLQAFRMVWHPQDRSRM